MNEPKSANREPLNVLFVCSRNQWRSPTAEKLWRNHPGLRVRSAGTSPNARRHVSASDLHWADAIVVMEGKHPCACSPSSAASSNTSRSTC